MTFLFTIMTFSGLFLAFFASISNQDFSTLQNSIKTISWKSIKNLLYNTNSIVSVIKTRLLIIAGVFFLILFILSLINKIFNMTIHYPPNLILIILITIFFTLGIGTPLFAIQSFPSDVKKFFNHTHLENLLGLFIFITIIIISVPVDTIKSYFIDINQSNVPILVGLGTIEIYFLLYLMGFLLLTLPILLLFVAVIIPSIPMYILVAILILCFKVLIVFFRAIFSDSTITRYTFVKIFLFTNISTTIIVYYLSSH